MTIREVVKLLELIRFVVPGYWQRRIDESIAKIKHSGIRG
jgi:hypothetical protein